VYRSIIECCINYCILIFGNAATIHLSKLEIVQKKAVRIVAMQPRLSHTNPLFSCLRLLKVSDQCKYNLGIYMWKNIDKFTLRVNTNNTRSGDYYAPPYHRLSLTKYQSIYYHLSSTIKLGITYSGWLHTTICLHVVCASS